MSIEIISVERLGNFRVGGNELYRIIYLRDGCWHGQTNRFAKDELDAAMLFMGEWK